MEDGISLASIILAFFAIFCILILFLRILRIHSIYRNSISVSTLTITIPKKIGERLYIKGDKKEIEGDGVCFLKVGEILSEKRDCSFLIEKRDGRMTLSIFSFRIFPMNSKPKKNKGIFIFEAKFPIIKKIQEEVFCNNTSKPDEKEIGETSSPVPVKVVIPVKIENEKAFVDTSRKVEFKLECKD